MRDLVVAVWLISLATWINLAATCAVQWAIKGLFDKHVPFWPLFVAMLLVGSLVGRSSTR